MKRGKALVVLSGGQDSTTCLFWAVHHFGVENVRTVTFDYGQRHSIELDAANSVAHLAGISPHHRSLVVVGDVLMGTSPLTNPDVKLETYEDYDSMNRIIGSRVEKTFVPLRNALFLTLAANRAAAHGYHQIVTGVCQADGANYPDCTRPFIEQMSLAINEALGFNWAGAMENNGPWIKIHTPLMYLAKHESIQMALELPGCYSALAYTHTAYDGLYPPTGKDHASILRARGFEDALWPDPLVVRAVLEGAMEKPTTGTNYLKYWDVAVEAIRTEMKAREPEQRLGDWWLRG